MEKTKRVAKKNIKPYVDDGRYCSKCGGDLDIEYDDDKGYYLYCPYCREEVRTNKESLPF